MWDVDAQRRESKTGTRPREEAFKTPLLEKKDQKNTKTGEGGIQNIIIYLKEYFQLFVDDVHGSTAG